MYPGSMTEDRSPDAAAALATIATILFGAVLVLIRDHVNNDVIALLLAAAVVVSGALGGRRAGVAAALAAAVSFNFFHTQPYLSLRIHDADDIWTTLTLLAVGLVSGLTAQVAGKRRVAAEEVNRELRAVGRISALVARGADPEDVEVAVEAELLELLQLAGIARTSTPDDRAVLLERTGTDQSRHLVFHDGGFELPAEGLAIPVESDGLVVGYVTCTPRPGRAVSLAARRTAVLLTDLLGASIAARTRRFAPTPSAST
jgi:K+-sensing histidine kinase KdpD